MGDQVVFFADPPVSKTAARYGFAFYTETGKAMQTRDTLREIIGCIVERAKAEERERCLMEGFSVKAKSPALEPSAISG